jgi:hypothetical protein
MTETKKMAILSYMQNGFVFMQLTLQGLSDESWSER